MARTPEQQAATHLRQAAKKASDSNDPYFLSLGKILWRLDAHQIGGRAYDALLLDLLTEHLRQFPNGTR